MWVLGAQDLTLNSQSEYDVHFVKSVSGWQYKLLKNCS
jgi:hypothetical protein